MNTTTIKATDLTDFDGADITSAIVNWRGKDYPVKVYDDGYGEWHLIGQEFGPTLLVLAKGQSSAFDIWLDESPTIDSDDLPEAYGFYLMQACKWSDRQSTAPWYVCSDDHGKPTSESVLVCNGDRNTIGGPFQTAEAARAYCMEYVAENELSLVEGYDYQSNSSGTGIVNVGDSVWQERIDPADITLTVEHDE